MSITLQVFNLNGGITFYDLAPYEGVVHIGRGPDNDIPLDDPGLAVSHLVLDCRRTPYHLVVLSRQGNPTVDGALARPNVAIPLTDGSVIRVANYEFRLLAASAPVRERSAPALPPAPSSPAPAPPPPRPPEENYPAPPYSAPASPVIDHPPAPPPVPAARDFEEPPQEPVSHFPVRPLDAHDPNILLDPLGFDESRTLTVNPGDEISFQIELTNNGDRFAEMRIALEGLPSHWPKIQGGGSIRIRQEESAVMTITIAPPRHASSRAGTYHFAVVVSSPHFNQAVSQFGATLLINPYYEFAVTEISPKRKTISWFKRSQEFTFTVANRGNSPAAFRLSGQDDERACSYEFHNVPGEPVALTGETPLRLLDEYAPHPPAMDDAAATHNVALPVHVRPYSRPFILRSRVHRFTITVTPLDEQQTVRRLAGELKQKPFLSWYTLLPLTLLMLLVCTLGFIFTFRPHIDTFTINDQVAQTNIKAGEPVVLSWSASSFANLRIDPDVGPLDRTRGQATAMPPETTDYTLRSENFLSRLPLLSFLSENEERKVVVLTAPPAILDFSVDNDSVVAGQEVILTWNVENAENLILFTNNAPENIENPADQAAKSPREDTVYVLEARNRYGARQENVMVTVSQPTPVPGPTIEYFRAVPAQLTAGERVTLNWLVSEADIVTINPPGVEVAPESSIFLSPQQTTLYVLEARKEGVSQPARAVQEVAVSVPTGTPTATPTPEPVAPQIIDFAASKTEFILGDAEGDGGDESSNKSVVLVWTIEGDVTDVQLANKDNVILETKLTPIAQTEVRVDENDDLFTLIAFNGEKSNRKSIALQVKTATPTPPPTPTPTPPPTATATPLPPNIVFFKAEAGPDETDKSVVLPIPSDNSETSTAYEVIAGSVVKLSWLVENSTQVTLKGEGDGLGERKQPFEGDITLPPIIKPERYTLFAKNEGNSLEAVASLELDIETRKPLAPTNFKVTLDTSTSTPAYKFKWFYDNKDRDDILGFRLYRASNGSNDYGSIQDEGELGADAAEGTVTPANETACDQFYLVAVYQDIVSGDRLETDSSNQWRSASCP